MKIVELTQNHFIKKKTIAMMALRKDYATLSSSVLFILGLDIKGPYRGVIRVFVDEEDKNKILIAKSKNDEGYVVRYNGHINGSAPWVYYVVDSMGIISYDKLFFKMSTDPIKIDSPEYGDLYVFTLVNELEEPKSYQPTGFSHKYYKIEAKITF
jgi:hypothetical protein